MGGEPAPPAGFVGAGFRLLPADAAGEPAAVAGGAAGAGFGGVAAGVGAPAAAGFGTDGVAGAAGGDDADDIGTALGAPAILAAAGFTALVAVVAAAGSRPMRQDKLLFE